MEAAYQLKPIDWFRSLMKADEPISGHSLVVPIDGRVQAVVRG
jgi:hypothetical protein